MYNSKDTSSSPTPRIRDWLAIGITLGSILALFVLALVAVIRAHTLDILLPVLATWVGTVIAYYFSKENFERLTCSPT